MIFTLIWGLILTLTTHAQQGIQFRALQTGEAQLPTKVAIGHSSAPSISADARIVVFLSEAANLASGDRNGEVDVFLKDRQTGEMKLVSANLRGTGSGNRGAYDSSISADGRYVLFESFASDLVTNDFNNTSDIFLRDVVSNITYLVTMNKEGIASGNGASSRAVMTPDARFIVYQSFASDLANSDTNGMADVFMYDRMLKSNILISVSSDGPGSANGTSSDGQPTADGAFVVFRTTATNTTLGDTNSSSDIVVRDLAGRTNILISRRFDRLGPGDQPSFNPVISVTGSAVAFTSNSTNLLADARTNTTSVVLSDRVTKSSVRVNVNEDQSGMRVQDFLPVITPDGRFVCYPSTTNIYLFDARSETAKLVTKTLDGVGGASGVAQSPCLSDDGRFAAFLSSATNLVTNTIVSGFQVFLRDNLNETTVLISRDMDGRGSGGCSALAMTPSASYIAFQSAGTNLVAGDTNEFSDIFVWERLSGRIERVSEAGNTVQSSTSPDWITFSPQPLSADGRLLVYGRQQRASVNNPLYLPPLIEVRNLQSGAVSPINVATNLLPASSGFDSAPIISADGRFAAFASRMRVLVPGTYNTAVQLVLRNLISGETVLVGPTNGFPLTFSILDFGFAAGGRFLIYTPFSRSLNTGPGGPSYAYDTTSKTNLLIPGGETAFPVISPEGTSIVMPTATPSIYDLITGETRSLPGVVSQPPFSRIPSISAVNRAMSRDGRFVAYLNDTNLFWADTVTGATNVLRVIAKRPSLSDDGRWVAFYTFESDRQQAFVWDTSTNAAKIVSTKFGDNKGGNSDSWAAVISPNGRFVAFRSTASDIVSQSAEGGANLFLHDLRVGTTALLTQNSAGNPGNAPSSFPVFGRDSQSLIFTTFADNIVPNDFNQGKDVVFTRLQGNSPGEGDSFRIITVTSLKTGQVAVLWNSIKSRSYRVWATENLAQLEWRILAGEIVATSETASVTDLAGVGLSQRFYRVELLPTP